MKLSKNLFVILFTSFLPFCSASAQVKFSCLSKTYTIPVFKQDTIERSFFARQFERLNILPSIKQSKYEFELRGYYEVVNPWMASVVVIKGNKDALYVEAYYYHMQRDEADTIAPKGFSTTKWKKRNVYYSVKSVAVSDTLLNSLIKNKLFEIPNIDSIKKDLKNKHITVEPTRAFDPYYMSFELKVNNKFRSFYCDPFAYWTNKNIAELKPQALLFNEFNDLYIKSGQVLNHLFP